MKNFNGYRQQITLALALIRAAFERRQPSVGDKWSRGMDNAPNRFFCRSRMFLYGHRCYVTSRPMDVMLSYFAKIENIWQKYRYTRCCSRHIVEILPKRPIAYQIQYMPSKTNNIPKCHNITKYGSIVGNASSTTLFLVFYM